MNRFELAEEVYRLKVWSDAISVVTMSVLPSWHIVGGTNRLHIDIAAMSMASSVALGIAIAQPDKQVICIDGDGSLLMELGILATIGSIKPKNLHYFLANNGKYDSSGCQALPLIPNWEFVREFGIHWSTSIPESIQLIMGPVFYDISIDSGLPDIWPKLDLKGQINKFQKQLGLEE